MAVFPPASAGHLGVAAVASGGGGIGPVGLQPVGGIFDESRWLVFWRKISCAVFPRHAHGTKFTFRRNDRLARAAAAAGCVAFSAICLPSRHGSTKKFYFPAFFADADL